MGDVRLDALTAQQVTCLRLLAELHTFKAVARALSLSPKTVENHIAAARSTLGGIDRFEAAALVVEFDRASGKAPSGKTPIAEPDQITPTRGVDQPTGDRLRDVASDPIFSFDLTCAANDGYRLEGTARRALAPLHIAALICVIAVAITALVILAAASTDAWMKIANTIEPYH